MAQPDTYYDIKFLINSSALLRRKKSTFDELNQLNASEDTGESLEIISYNRKEYIPLDFDYGTIFITTDKTKYNLNERVNIQILNLDSNLKASPDPIIYEIKNPKGIIVERFLNATSESGIIMTKFNLSSNALYGLWHILAYSGKNFLSSNEITFLVQSYTIPPFQIKIDVSNKVIFKGDKFHIVITAFYNYDEEVKGNVFVEIGTKTNTGKINAHLKMDLELVNGKTNITVKDTETFESTFPLGSYLYIKAIVIEKTSGIKEILEHSTTIFSVNEYSIDLISNSNRYIPGSPYYFQGKVMHKVKNSANTIPLEIRAIAVPNNAHMKIVYNSLTISDSKGLFHIKINMPNDTDIEFIQITVKIPKIVVSSNWKIHPYDPSYKIFVKIEPHWDPLFVGQAFQPKIHISSIQKPFDLHFLIICKNKIFKHGIHLVIELPELRFQLSEEMFPHFHLVVYIIYKYGDNREYIISDWSEFELNKPCNIDISLKSPQYNPEEKLVLIVKGIPDAFVSFFAMDRALQFYDIAPTFSSASVHDYLKSKHTRSKTNSLIVEDVFSTLGFTFITNIGPRKLSRRQNRGKRSVAYNKNSISNLIDIDKRLGFAKNLDKKSSSQTEIERKYFPQTWLFETRKLK
ncbi:unnamed protein product [Gordionus sp. m RMFG-2023]